MRESLIMPAQSSTLLFLITLIAAVPITNAGGAGFYPRLLFEYQKSHRLILCLLVVRLFLSKKDVNRYLPMNILPRDLGKVLVIEILFKINRANFQK